MRTYFSSINLANIKIYIMFSVVEGLVRLIPWLSMKDNISGEHFAYTVCRIQSLKRALYALS